MSGNVSTAHYLQRLQGRQVSLSAYLSVYIYLSVCLSVCLSIYLRVDYLFQQLVLHYST